MSLDPRKNRFPEMGKQYGVSAGGHAVRQDALRARRASKPISQVA